MKNSSKYTITTACYLKNNSKILMIKFNNKWEGVYSPPGGHIEFGETPSDCIIREFKEETGLTLLNLRLQGISYWKQKDNEGIIFVFIASMFSGEMVESSEGSLHWIDSIKMSLIDQFEMNLKFSSFLFKPDIFEGNFEFDDQERLSSYKIYTI